MDFQARLDKALSLAGVSLVELAGRIGLPVRVVRGYETAPPRRICERIVDALDRVVSVDFLLDKV